MYDRDSFFLAPEFNLFNKGYRYAFHPQDLPSRRSLGMCMRNSPNFPADSKFQGGLITYTEGQLEEVAAAVAKFSANVTDPKAAIITASNFLLTQVSLLLHSAGCPAYLNVQPGVSQLLFYDGPTPPDGIFDDFLNIPHLTKDVETRDFISLVQSSPSNATSGQRFVPDMSRLAWTYF